MAMTSSPPLTSVKLMSCEEAVSSSSSSSSRPRIYHVSSSGSDGEVVFGNEEDRSGFGDAARQLRDGGLVAFPTETVYGLGANAFDSTAVLKIYEAKGRPLTDPCIVHVARPEDALALPVVDVDGISEGQDSYSPPTSSSKSTVGGLLRCMFEVLTSRLWPGPLTLVVPASSKIPKEVCAGGAFVGVRCPSHPVARRLIAEAGVPIAAPSANRFGHVSPTLAEHVVSDLGARLGNSLIVLDGGACSVGIESTVAKLQVEEGGVGNVIVLRQGGVQALDIRIALDDGALQNVEVYISQPRFATGESSEVAPGMLLTHYAPDVTAYLVYPSSTDSASRSFDGAPIADMSECVVLDVGKRLLHLKSHCMAYVDLSEADDAGQAAEKLFSALRWGESVEGAKAVCVVGLGNEDRTVKDDLDGTVLGAVRDRMFRAASGRVARVTADCKFLINR